jgi:hypothetical protein
MRHLRGGDFGGILLAAKVEIEIAGEAIKAESTFEAMSGLR